MRIRAIDILLLAGLAMCSSLLRADQPELTGTEPSPEKIDVGAGKTRLLDMPINIERVSIAAPETAEAVPVSARSMMVNGKAPGETSLIIWLADGSRREYTVDVKVNSARVAAAKEQISREFGDKVQVAVDNGAVYLTGRLKDLYEADRALLIAASLGKVVNLLKVDAPPQEQQILLKVRFADVDRTKSLNLGVNFFGAPRGYAASSSTGAFSPSTVQTIGSAGVPTTFTLSDTLNLLLWDPHANLGATLAALASQNVLQILAEPNLLAMNGKEASFVAGGEFPFPTLQGGGGGVGQITISFKEFGVRLHFVPTITPRGTIRLRVMPEVSSLDFANALVISGTTIPALDTRRVDTEVELQSGQSFAIAGLLDNQTTETLSKIPGLGNIPVLGKLFTSKAINKSNSELLVIITPELVAPLPEGQTISDLPRPDSFIQGPDVLTKSPRTPGTDVTGPVPAKPVRTEISVQELLQLQRAGQSSQSAPASSTGSSTPLVINPAAAMPLPGAGDTGTSAGRSN
ncbi:MAG TPA: pilus assembly protein N-terminal domain-containing protein [Bryobacteraceae bacterium]|nr:pilus assembly protein N-terminal domain-containing protein [Bryobacteraceae bacterium]